MESLCIANYNGRTLTALQLPPNSGDLSLLFPAHPFFCPLINACLSSPSYAD